MAGTSSAADVREVDPERVAVVWISTQRAVIARWAGEPVVEHLESGVPPRRRAVGSVRRGPARPEGGGRVKGHGTEARHDTELRRFLDAISSRLAGLEEIEVGGRGALPERFAELLRRLARRRNEDVAVTSRTLSRRPSDAQLKARLRRLADRELPRKLVGRYRLPPQGPTTPTGRPIQPAAGRRTLRPAREPEWREIVEAVEAMLAETERDATDGGADQGQAEPADEGQAEPAGRGSAEPPGQRSAGPRTTSTDARLP